MRFQNGLRKELQHELKMREIQTLEQSTHLAKTLEQFHRSNPMPPRNAASVAPRPGGNPRPARNDPPRVAPEARPC